MRCFSVRTVSLVILVAISLVLVSLSTSADEAPIANDPFGDAPATQSAPTPPVASTDESDVESAPALRFWVDDRDPDRTEKILAVLDAKLTSIGLDFQDSPIGEVVAFLRDEYSLQIQLDAPGLDDLGIGPDEPITANLQNIKLGSALRLMLKPMELAHVVQDGMLLITSEDEALSRSVVAVYPVADLLTEKPDWDTLINMIVMTVATDSWAENGGGESEVRAYPQRSALVISQTKEVHRQIAALLAALRECEANPEAKPLADPTPRGGGRIDCFSGKGGRGEKSGGGEGWGGGGGGSF